MNGENGFACDRNIWNNRSVGYGEVNNVLGICVAYTIGNGKYQKKKIFFHGNKFWGIIIFFEWLASELQ